MNARGNLTSNRARSLAAVALAAVLAAACGQESQVSVLFDHPRGLHAGAPVYLGDAEVGEVAGLSAGGEVELSLDAGAAASLRNGSAALVSTRDGETVIELYNYRPGQGTLGGGDRLAGLNDSMEYAAWQAGEAMETGEQSLDQMTESISEYFNSEEWRRYKEEMNRRLAELEDELGRAYEETSKAYREFLEQLESESESARERAEKSYAELARRLRERIAELKEQGNEHIIKPLQRLLEDLSRAMEKRPEQRWV